MNKTIQFMHPEVKFEVIKEFMRLRQRHSSLDGNALWTMSRDYVNIVSLIDTVMWKNIIFNDPLR